MPKDEFDFEDPLELNGVAFLTDEDTTIAMAECFAEEFLRMGYNHKQVLALFRDPHYLGPNMVLQNKGETFVRQLITEVFARWGKAICWLDQEGKVQVPNSKFQINSKPQTSKIDAANFGSTGANAHKVVIGFPLEIAPPNLKLSPSLPAGREPTDPLGNSPPEFNL